MRADRREKGEQKIERKEEKKKISQNGRLVYPWSTPDRFVVRIQKTLYFFCVFVVLSPNLCS